MKNYRESTQEISYAYSAQTSSGRALIKILENVTGRASLIKKAQNYELEVASGRIPVHLVDDDKLGSFTALLAVNFFEILHIYVENFEVHARE